MVMIEDLKNLLKKYFNDASVENIIKVDFCAVLQTELNELNEEEKQNAMKISLSNHVIKLCYRINEDVIYDYLEELIDKKMITISDIYYYENLSFNINKCQREHIWHHMCNRFVRYSLDDDITIFKFLIKHDDNLKININKRGRFGAPLHIVCNGISENYDVILKLITLLVDNGANINAKKSAKETPLSIFLSNLYNIDKESKKIIELFIKKGANTNIIDIESLRKLSKDDKHWLKHYFIEASGIDLK